MKFKHGNNLRIIDKRSVYIDDTVIIGNNVTIYENNRISGNTVIGDNVTIFPGCFVVDTQIGSNTELTSVNSNGAIVGNFCTLGPYARLRPNSIIKDNAKIGNFVEIKNAIIGEGSKVSHLAYVGDAEVGKNCNIGCGAIFVNYNGRSKNKIFIGDNCFIGSNCNLIAPLKVEDSCYICAGTTVTENVNKDDFVIGRVRQQIKENRAHEYLKIIERK